MRAHQRRILVIDDNAGARHARVRVLSDAGFQVVEATNVSEGLASCRAQAPDLVLSDIHLPDGNGYQFCRDARTLIADLPVILISAIYRDDASRSAATFAGACAFLSDPVPASVLVATVREHASEPGKTR